MVFVVIHSSSSSLTTSDKDDNQNKTVTLRNIDGMRKYGLIGYPLRHSFSKKYFTEKFVKEKIHDCSYDNYPLSSIDKLPGLITSDPYLCGLNVTIPYKSEVINYVDIIDTESAQIGAINVLKIKRLKDSFKLYGYNSDITGIMDTLAPVIRKERVKKALILGTGGSSKAVNFVLNKLSVEVTLVSRTRRPGVLIYADIDSRILKESGLIVNTTPLGLFPDKEGKPDIDYNLLGKNNILFDLVYNPEITTFLRLGKERGCKIITGLKMLHSQAEKAWEIWNNDDF